MNPGSASSYKWTDSKIKHWADRNGLGARDIGLVTESSSQTELNNK